MTRNNCYLLLSLLLIASNQAFSQEHLEGKLIDTNDQPVAYANVILLSPKDSVTVYKGTVSDEQGEFVFDKIGDTTYLLKVSFVGYQEHLQKVEAGIGSLQPIVLEEASSNLDEVTVKARRPKITQSVDRLTFNVENSTLSTGTTYDILKRTPGVIISQGQLLVKNRPATVYINDRKVYLSQQELQQLLEGFSGANVKSVEVITNPPAKYDAEGGAILNITTSKNISIGYKGSLNGSATIAKLPKYSAGTSQYYKNDWVNVFASYNFNLRDDLKKDEGGIVFYQPGGDVDSRWFTDFRRETNTDSHSINAIIDFTLSEKSSLSLSANILSTPKSDSDIDGRTDIYDAAGSPDSFFTTESYLENNRDNILLNANYDLQLGEKGAALSANANYISYDDSQTQNLLTSYFTSGESTSDNSFFTNAHQQTDIYTGQVDLSAPLGSLAMETGVKYSGIDSQSGLNFFDTNSGTYEFQENLSDVFDYSEKNYAGYLSIQKDWEKWSLKTGLRGEYTDISGNSASLGLVNTQSYFKLFPTFYLIHTINENNTIGLDYSRRITRPRFQSLNPYRYFLNETNYQEGNPDLRPGIADKITLNYTWKNKLSFDLYWDHINNSTAVLPFQDNQNHTLRTVNDNMDFEQQFSLDVSYYDYMTDWWYLYIYSSFFYMQADFYALESGNQVVTNDVFSTYIQAQNFLTLSADGTFSGEVTATFLPDYIAGSYDFEDPQYGLNIGLRKTFFNSRLTATINVDDIFNSMNVPLRSQYLNQNNYFFAKPESRQVRFGLIYKFGNFKLRDNNRSINADEGERLNEKTVL